MSGAFLLLLARATGPGRFRVRLRRQTRPVRVYRESSAPLARARAAIPRSVLGGDLLDLLSSQLRAALVPGEDASIGAATHNATRRPYLVTSAPGPGQSNPAPISRSVHDGSIDWLGSNSGPVGHQAGVVGRSSLSVGTAEASWLSASQTGERRAARDRVESGALATAGLPPVAKQQPPGSGPRAGVSQTALLRVLSEFWHSETDVARPEVAVTTPQVARPDARQKYSGESGGMPGTPSWPDVAGQDLAERIRAFARGNTGGSLGQTESVPPPGSPERVEIKNYFQLALGGDQGRGSPRELADRLADILREQALQHGIDIT